MKTQYPMKDNYGLYNGLMGETLTLYCAGVTEKNKLQKKLAKEKLNHIVSNIDAVKEFSLENGLLGIGWGIQWILSKKIVNADADEILAELDSKIYDFIMFSKSKDMSLETGAMGRILYIYYRLTYPYTQRTVYKEIPLKELLLLSVDELYGHLVTNKEDKIPTLKHKLSEKDMPQYLLQVGQAVQICLKVSRIITLRYIFDLHPILNQDIYEYLSALNKMEKVSFFPELVYLIQSYRESLVHYNDHKKIEFLDSFTIKHKNSISRVKNTVYKGWYTENVKTNYPKKIEDWKDGWLMI